MRRWVNENKFLLRPFLILGLIYLVGISAILLAGMHYADDIGRTERGYAVWANFSRYINEILSRFIHADNYLTNIAPLPQLMATFILAIASVMLLCVLVGKDRFRQPWIKWIGVTVAVVPLGLSPYMLECLSYQYDAVYMALSVFFVVLPFVFRKRNFRLYLAAIVVGTFGVCMTYQAVIGVFPMMMVFVLINDWSEKIIGRDRSEKKEYAKKTIVALAVFGLTLIVFQKFLMIPRDLYVSNSLPSLQDYIPETVKHLGQYFGLLMSDFKIWWLILAAIIMVIFVVLFVQKSKQNKVLAVVVSMIGILVMVVCTFLVYASLSAPLFAPRAMYAVGICLAIIFVYVVNNSQKIITKVPVWILVWCFFVFAFTYGNALAEQDEYRNMKIDMVMGDLIDLSVMQNDEMKIIQVSGDVGLSPIITHMPQDYQILNRLLASSFNEGLIWTTYELVYLSDMGKLRADMNVDLTKMDLPIVKDTAYYNIRADDSNILVEFKKSHRD